MNRVPMRDGYGKALLELCRLHEDVVVLDADVAKSTRLCRLFLHTAFF